MDERTYGFFLLAVSAAFSFYARHTINQALFGGIAFCYLEAVLIAWRENFIGEYITEKTYWLIIFVCSCSLVIFPFCSWFKQRLLFYYYRYKLYSNFYMESGDTATTSDLEFISVVTANGWRKESNDPGYNVFYYSTSTDNWTSFNTGDKFYDLDLPKDHKMKLAHLMATSGSAV